VSVNDLKIKSYCLFPQSFSSAKIQIVLLFSFKFRHFLNLRACKNDIFFIYHGNLEFREPARTDNSVWEIGPCGCGRTPCISDILHRLLKKASVMVCRLGFSYTPGTSNISRFSFIFYLI
jgi:hypothetical protein